MFPLATLWYRQGVDSEQNEHNIFLQVSDWSTVDHNECLSNK